MSVLIQFKASEEIRAETISRLTGLENVSTAVLIDN